MCIMDVINVCISYEYIPIKRGYLNKPSARMSEKNCNNKKVIPKGL